MALFGILLVLAAGSVRLVPAVGVVSGFEGLSGYAIPAAGFGFIVAILFDARLAVLTALAVAAITGISTGDTGYAVYALLSAIGPVPFVSAISTRADFRRALGYASALAGTHRRLGSLVLPRSPSRTAGLGDRVQGGRARLRGQPPRRRSSPAWPCRSSRWLSTSPPPFASSTSPTATTRPSRPSRSTPGAPSTTR